MKTKLLAFIISTLLISGIVLAQDNESRIKHYLIEHQKELSLSESDISNWVINNEYTDKNREISFVYISQTYKEIAVFGAVGTFAIQNEKVYFTGNRLIENLDQKVRSTKPILTASEGLIAAAQYVGIESSVIPKLIEEKNKSFLFESGNISQEKIPIKLVLVPNGDEIRIAWDVSIYTHNSEHFWSIRIDAISGEELNRIDWVSNCKFDGVPHKESSHLSINPCALHKGLSLNVPLPPPGTDQYSVFAEPIESPNHGFSSTVIGPANLTASPFGWHDTNGIPGPESTQTIGNNVHAQEDHNGNNGIGAMPNGGPSLQFNFPINLNQSPFGYVDAATTNLFYWCNILHDVWYQYGFDEQSGNFQQNNYGNGGMGSDFLFADSQDLSGFNNASFACPPDGTSGRLQMFFWAAPNPNGAPSDLFTVNSPSSLAGVYTSVLSGFGPGLTNVPITESIVIYDDNVPDEYDACELPINAAALNGKIALIRRGTCSFPDKVINAENAGAVAVIMVNDTPGAPFLMGGNGPGISIPSLMISDVDGAALISAIEAGAIVNATIVDSVGSSHLIDSDFDNGLISHEYGHGISIRLAGGASNSGCLYNAEQMGEGWSDWFALMMTIEPGDLGADIRGFSTYSDAQPVNSVGIRPAPYSTSFGVNNFTYASTNNTSVITQPHGIGFVWCSMLWDLTWALIDRYGYDPDLYNGTGGNNKVMDLVITALKLQPCSPGFVDGRDAILQADQLLNGGVNECLIWNAFAARGLGASADQGSSLSRTDQIEAFDLPVQFFNVTSSETVSTCGNYTWPTNGVTYNSSGIYDQILPAASGCDSIVTLNLTLNNSPLQTDVIQSCGPYTWIDGNTYTNSNSTATVTYTNSVGCDSTIALNLTIYNGLTGSDYVVNCGPYTWMDGNTYTANNSTATFNVPNSAGCDSIVTLNLTVINPSAGTDTVTHCGPYTWIDGNIYIFDNSTATVNYTNAAGCDSIVTLNLTVNYNSTGTDVVENCEPFTWIDGNTYTSDTSTATYTLTNAAGCDSIVTLNLTINDSSSSIINATSIDFYTAPSGAVYSTSGTYIDTIPNVAGCDSVITIVLTIDHAGIDENDSKNVKVFPNPSSKLITISITDALIGSTIEIIDKSGRVYSTEISSALDTHVNIENLASGVYFVKIGKIIHVKFVKN